MKHFLFLIFIFNFSFLIFNLSQAHAQQSLTIMPPTIEHEVNKGEAIEGTIRVVNQGLNQAEINTFVKDFIVDNPDGIPKIIENEKLPRRFSASQWLAVVPTTFTLQAKEAKEIQYFVQVPMDAAPGGRYSAVIFSPESGKKNDITGTFVQTKLATLVSIIIRGPVREKAVAELTTTRFWEYGPIKISAVIENQGDVHIKPQGNIRIYDIFQRIIDSQKISGFNIFPKAQRSYETNLGQKYMFGLYKASLDANYGTGKKLSAQVYLFVIPWKETIVGMLAVVALILSIIYWRKKLEIASR